MKLIFPIALWAAARTALAHEGHGDSVLHALAHFFEANGVAIWLTSIAIGSLGLYRFFNQREHKK